MASMNLHIRSANLHRRVVCGQADGAFISQQFWYDHEVRTIFWDLDLLFQTMRLKWNRMMKRNKFLKEFNNRVLVDIPIIEDLPFQLWESHPMAVAPSYNWHSKLG